MGIDSMEISVTLLPEKSKKTLHIPKGTLIIDMLRSMNISPDAVIVLRKNKPIPVDEILDHEEYLSILTVASGG